DLRSARPVPGAERVAEVAHRRSRRTGNADLLEHRQERIGRGRPTQFAHKENATADCSPVAFLFLVAAISSGCPEPVPGHRSTAGRGFAAAAGWATDDP